MACDVVIRNGTLVDGTGALRFRVDIAIFDDNTMGSARWPKMRCDLPGGGRWLVMPAQGVQYTLVNGQVLYAEQQYTGALPGQVLRAGGL